MKFPAKILKYALLLSTVCFIISGCAVLVPKEPTLEKDFILRVGVAIRPPFVFKDEKQQYAGLDIALLKLLAEENNFQLEITEYPLNELIFALRRGEVDIIAAGYTDDEMTANFFIPCAPHLRTGQRIIVNGEIAPFITDKSQLDNEKITVYTVAGSASADKAKTIFSEAKTASLKDIASCVEKVRNGKGNIMLLSARDAAPLAADRQNKLAIVLGVMGDEDIVWGVRRKEDRWKFFLDNYMRSLMLEGRLKKIIDETQADLINK